MTDESGKGYSLLRLLYKDEKDAKEAIEKCVIDEQEMLAKQREDLIQTDNLEEMRATLINNLTQVEKRLFDDEVREKKLKLYVLSPLCATCAAIQEKDEQTLLEDLAKSGDEIAKKYLTDVQDG